MGGLDIGKMKQACEYNLILVVNNISFVVPAVGEVKGAITYPGIIKHYNDEIKVH